jgi:hypothetical protein
MRKILNEYKKSRFGVLTAVTTKTFNFRDVTPCSPLKVNTSSPPSGSKTEPRNNQHERGSKQNFAWLLLRCKATASY